MRGCPRHANCRPDVLLPAQRRRRSRHGGLSSTPPNRGSARRRPARLVSDTHCRTAGANETEPHNRVASQRSAGGLAGQLQRARRQPLAHTEPFRLPAAGLPVKAPLYDPPPGPARPDSPRDLTIVFSRDPHTRGRRPALRGWSPVKRLWPSVSRGVRRLRHLYLPVCIRPAGPGRSLRAQIGPRSAVPRAIAADDAYRRTHPPCRCRFTIDGPATASHGSVCRRHFGGNIY